MSLPDRSENERRDALRKARRKETNAGYDASAKGRARKARYMAHKGRAKNRRFELLRKYDITPAQYDKMFALQDGKCVGCGRPPKTRRLAVEHDHKTKRVRGLACHNCNRHLIGKNTAETARWLVAYLSSEFDGRTL